MYWWRIYERHHHGRYGCKGNPDECDWRLDRMLQRFHDSRRSLHPHRQQIKVLWNDAMLISTHHFIISTIFITISNNSINNNNNISICVINNIIRHTTYTSTCISCSFYTCFVSFLRVSLINVMYERYKWEQELTVASILILFIVSLQNKAICNKQ